MKKIKKLITGLLGIALLMSVLYPIPAKAAEPALEVNTPDNKAITYKYGEPQDFVLKVTNTGDTKLTNIVISPKLRNNSEKWPFKTEYQSYTEVVKELNPDPSASAEVKFHFTQRDDIGNGRYVLTFDIKANDENGNEVISSQQSFYVNTTAKPEENNEKENHENNEGNPEESAGGLEMASAGGIENGGASFSGGGDSSSNSSVPRVIVTGFDTDPAEVKAGSNFTLIIHLKNTSKATKVSNMLFDLSAPTEGTDEQTTAPAFLPASGSNSIYLDGIKADGTADIAIQLNAKADLVQKPYSINLSMKYEDKNAAQIEGASSISIPVKQDARFEFSEFEITPEMIAVGEEANVSCSLYNLGRIKLYNVKAVFEGTGIKREEVFIGNIDSGATASIDAMLEGANVTAGPETVKMTVSYEDEAGAVSTVEKELKLEVSEVMDQMAMTDMPIEESKGLPVIPIIAVAAVVILIAVIVIVRKMKKKKLLLQEEEGLLDELDGPSEDE